MSTPLHAMDFTLLFFGGDLASTETTDGVVKEYHEIQSNYIKYCETLVFYEVLCYNLFKFSLEWS